jgi:glucokinase
MDQAIVGVDIGGTNTVIGIFDSSFQLIQKTNMPTLRPGFPKKTNNPVEFFDKLGDEILALAERAGYSGQLLCAGFGVPGKVNPGKGIAVNAVNLGYDNVPFASEMSKRLGVPVFIDNDVRNYTRGEAIAGSAKGYQNVVCVTLGTGMAAGVMVEGNLIIGSDFYAGEIGHDIVPGAHARCNCGRLGCLETIASASGVSRLAKEAAAGGSDTLLKNIDGHITSKDVFQAAKNGDQTAVGIFQYVGRTLAQKLVTVTMLLNPEVIVIGGGVAAAGDMLLGPIKEVFDEQLGLEQSPIITVGSLGDSAGLYGSAQLAFKNYQNETNVKEGTLS